MLHFLSLALSSALPSTSSYAREQQCVLPPSGQTDLLLSISHIQYGQMAQSDALCIVHRDAHELIAINILSHYFFLSNANK